MSAPFDLPDFERMFEVYVKGDSFSRDALGVLREAEKLAIAAGTKIGVPHLVRAILTTDNEEAKVMSRTVAAAGRMLEGVKGVNLALLDFKAVADFVDPPKEPKPAP